MTVKDLDQVKIYTPVVSNPNKPEEKTQFVYVYDKATKEVKQVDQTTISTEIKAVQYEKTTTKYGETVTKTDDIELIKTEKPEVKIVVDDIETVYGKEVIENVKSVKIVEQEETATYQVVTEVKGQVQ